MICVRLNSVRLAVFLGVCILAIAGAVSGQGLPVPPFTIPPAGVDTINITMVETYTVNGVGTDTVTLQGTLVTRRGDPLLGPGQTTHSWEHSTVIAEFTTLNLSGTSTIFGPVNVSLNGSRPTMAAVTAGKCAASANVNIAMPALGLSLTTAQAVQLQSQVTTIPPIGDEKTQSVNSVALIDSSGRTVGTLVSARVLWRELVSQSPYGSSTSASATTPANPAAPPAEAVAAAGEKAATTASAPSPR